MYAKEEILKRGYKVLVIDDDTVVANVTMRVLDRAGFAVKTAFSGAEGLEIAESFQEQYATRQVLVFLQ